MSDVLGDMSQIVYCWYANVPKLDSLLSQIQGRLETERTEETSKGVDGKGSVSAEVGGILASLGLAKLTGGVELSGSVSKVLAVTTTLSPENKALVLAEYLQRAGQLAVSSLETQSEQELVQGAARSPFHLVQGLFERSWPTAERGVLRSQMQSSRGGPVLEVPLLLDNMRPDQNTPDDGDFVGHGVLGQMVARPGRLTLSPIAVWFANVSPSEFVLTYWQPSSVAATTSVAPLTAPAPSPEP